MHEVFSFMGKEVLSLLRLVNMMHTIFTVEQFFFISHGRPDNEMAKKGRIRKTRNYHKNNTTVKAAKCKNSSVPFS